MKADLRLFDESAQGTQYRAHMDVSPHDRACRTCHCAVGPHIATFSFRKSFRTHAFASSWRAAERILASAKKWVFIGYSLPHADYEFKHLLKTLHASGRRPAKEIDVVVRDDQTAEANYRSFFGQRSVNVFQAGLERYAGQMLKGAAEQQHTADGASRRR